MSQALNSLLLFARGNKLRKVILYIKKKSPSDFIMTLMAVATDVNYRFLKRILLESV